MGKEAKMRRRQRGFDPIFGKAINLVEETHRCNRSNASLSLLDNHEGLVRSEEQNVHTHPPDLEKLEASEC